ENVAVPREPSWFRSGEIEDDTSHLTGSVIVLASGDAPRAHIHGAPSPALIPIVVLIKSRWLRLLINRCISAAKAAGIDKARRSAGPAMTILGRASPCLKKTAFPGCASLLPNCRDP